MRPRWRGRDGGNTLGAMVGGPRGTAGMKAHWVLRGGPCWGGPGSQGSSRRVGGYRQQRRRRKAEEDGLAGSLAAWRFPC